MVNNRNSGAIDFKIIRKIKTIVEYQTGWNMELNVVSWNGGVPKYDIRNWSPTHDRMTKGLTLYEAEAKALAEKLHEVMVKEKDNLKIEMDAFKENNADVPMREVPDEESFDA